MFVKRGKVIVEDSVSEKIDKWMKSDTRGLVLTGPTGSGKTTLALQISSELLDNEEVNNYRETQRQLLQFNFVSAATLPSEKRPSSCLFPSRTVLPSVNVIDEAHAITALEATRFLAPLEQKGNKVIFCTNKIHSIPQELLTRCLVIQLKYLPEDVKAEFGISKVNMRADDVISDVEPISDKAERLYHLIINGEAKKVLDEVHESPRLVIKELFDIAVRSRNEFMLPYFSRLLFDFKESLGPEQLKVWAYGVALKYKDQK